MWRLLGDWVFERLIHIICDETDDRISTMVRRALGHLVNQHDQQVMQILDLDRQIVAWHRGNEVSRRLATIPDIGPLAASALAATIGDAKVFRSGRAQRGWRGQFEIM